MGTFGLWKYVSAHHVQYQADQVVTDGVDHLLLDMNGVLHLCYRGDKPTFRDTISAVMSLLAKILGRFRPLQSLVVAFDGPSPTAKLSAQRERRQAMLRNPKTVELNEAQIVTGGAFVQACEDEVVRYLRHAHETRKLCGVPISSSFVMRISGCRVPGEGEAKIAEELSRCFENSRRESSYNPDDRIVVVGNDSDLILTCLGCTPYHNFYVVNPNTWVATHVGELLVHWAAAVPNKTLPIELLPSYRVDFVFLMALAGCDYFSGVEDDAVMLWRKYRRLRSDGGFFRKSLVQPNGDINVELFRAVVARDHGHMRHYVGSKNKRKSVKQAGSSAPSAPGVELVRGARWVLHTLCGAACPDYSYHFRGEAAKLAHLRAAVRGNSSINARTAVRVSTEPPLLPLQVYVAVVSRPSMLPAAVLDVLTTRGTEQKFTTSTSTGTILAVLSETFAALDSSKLSAAEQIQMLFGDPVELSERPSVDTSHEERGNPNQPAPAPHSFSFSYPLTVTEIRVKNLYDNKFSVMRRYSSFDCKHEGSDEKPSAAKPDDHDDSSSVSDCSETQVSDAVD